MDIFHNFFYVPIFNLLMALYSLLGNNLGLAIIAVAFIGKLVTYPLTRRQIESAEKMRVFQEKSKELRKKHKNDQETMTKELTKMQAQYLPGQLGGCLNLIIIVVLLIQVRGVLINLVNQGVHAFNQVAYVESTKIPEDSISFRVPEGTNYGLHTVKYTVKASNGATLVKSITFGLAENEEQKKSLTDEINNKKNNMSEEERNNELKLQEEERKSNIALYIDAFSSTHVLIGTDQEIKAFLRPPSNQTIDYSSLEVRFNDNKLPEDKVSYTQGRSLNMEFLGADLSRVATDIGFGNPVAVMPYVIIAVLVGITQYFASLIQAGFAAAKKPKQEESNKNKKDRKKDKDKDKDEEPDFSEMMAQSSKQMMFIFPVITALMSLGYLGGATIFPAGVSLFWTGQNGFVIIEQLFVNRTQVSEKLLKLKERFIKNGQTGNTKES